MSLISIIVPCYNQAQYLDECLQSVLDQTYTDWECIIVNDGSPDNTEEIAKKWVEKDSRFKYFYKENSGLSSARNAGIEIANGEWILPLDSDDKIGSQYLEFASKEFYKGYSVIYCNAVFFGSETGKWALLEFSFDRLLCSNHIFCSAFYKKEDWILVNGYDENLIYGREDWEFWINILNKNSKVLKLNYLGFFYRRKKESMDVEINKDSYKKIFSENYIYKKHLDKYLQLDNNAVVNYQLVNSRLNELSSLSYTINKNKLTRLLYKIIKQFS